MTGKACETRAYGTMKLEFVCTPEAFGLNYETWWRRHQAAVSHLAREGLLEIVEDYSGERDNAFFSFRLTSYGIELFTAAMGLPDVAIGGLLKVDPALFCLDPPFGPGCRRAIQDLRRQDVRL